MNCIPWQWQPGKVDLSDRYFELKFGNDPRPVTRIGIKEDKIFIVEFLLNHKNDIEKQQEIFSEIIWEIELYLINNSEHDPIEYMINHTKKCANMYSRIHWNYFPKGASKSILLKKEFSLNDKVKSIKKFFTKMLSES
jgi:hypothetical protein